jgi:hypothetical protein
MSVVVLVLLFAAVLVALGLLVGMYTKDRPFYGAMAVCLLTGPCAVLAFAYVATGV